MLSGITTVAKPQAGPSCIANRNTSNIVSERLTISNIRPARLSRNDISFGDWRHVTGQASHLETEVDDIVGYSGAGPARHLFCSDRIACLNRGEIVAHALDPFCSRDLVGV